MRRIIREHEGWLRMVDTGSAYVVEVDRPWWFGSYKTYFYHPVLARLFFTSCAKRGWSYSVKNLV